MLPPTSPPKPGYRLGAGEPDLAGTDFLTASPSPTASLRQAVLGDVPEIVARLGRETAPVRRTRLFDALVSARAAAQIRQFLGNPAPDLRNGAVAALKALGVAAGPALDDALNDRSADVRLLAVEVLRAWPPALAATRLSQVLRHDAHVNVCAAAADVAAARGAPALIPALHGLARRFPDDPFIQFCAQVALARLSDGALTSPGLISGYATSKDPTLDDSTFDRTTPDERNTSLRDVDLQSFIEFFYRHTGIRFAESRFYYLNKQLTAQAGLRGYAPHAYLAWLTTSEPAAEITALMQRFCAPRALFFSPAAPPPPLAAWLPYLSGDSPVWVTANDDGQTAYSLALYQKETQQSFPLTAQLNETAATGLFERAALSALGPELAARWFTEQHGRPLTAFGGPREHMGGEAGSAPALIDPWGETAFTVADTAPANAPVSLKSTIRASVEPVSLGGLPRASMALIVCDHMLVYEPVLATEGMAARLYDALRPGGVLCLGAGETLSRASGLFNVIPCAGGVAYQKPNDATGT